MNAVTPQPESPPGLPGAGLPFTRTRKNLDPKVRQRLLSISIILVVVVLSVLMLLFQDQIKVLEGWGYVGLFLVAFFASAAMFAPVPGLIFLGASAKMLDPFAAGMIFAVGAALGELSGYLVGITGRGVVEKTKWHKRMERWIIRYGGFVIVLLGFIPNPLIDIAGMVAGALKMPWYQFLLWVLIGKIPKALLITYGVSFALKWFGVQ